MAINMYMSLQEKWSLEHSPSIHLVSDITGNLNASGLPLKYGTRGFDDLKHGHLVRQIHPRSDCFLCDYLLVMFS